MMGYCGWCGGWGGSLGLGSWGIVGWLINLVITLLVIGGVIWLVVWVVHKLTTSGTSLFRSSEELASVRSPKEVLQIRYARGEITREQYLEMLADLS